jgi:hypothetical protein
VVTRVAIKVATKVKTSSVEAETRGLNEEAAGAVPSVETKVKKVNVVAEVREVEVKEVAVMDKVAEEAKRRSKLARTSARLIQTHKPNSSL